MPSLDEAAAAFARWDRSSTGLIGKQLLEKVIRELDPGIDPKPLADLLALVGVDAQGRVNYRRFLKDLEANEEVAVAAANKAQEEGAAKKKNEEAAAFAKKEAEEAAAKEQAEEEATARTQAAEEVASAAQQKVVEEAAAKGKAEEEAAAAAPKAEAWTHVLSVKWDGGRHSQEHADRVAQNWSRRPSHTASLRKRAAEAANTVQLGRRAREAAAHFGSTAYYPNRHDKTGICGKDCHGYDCRFYLESGGNKPTNAWCWAASFYWHLAVCKEKGGKMIQVIEADGALGEGQKLEQAMAENLDLEIEVWRG